VAARFDIMLKILSEFAHVPRSETRERFNGVAVSPRYRGGGIGSMLLFSALDWLKRSRVRYATLEEETFSYRNKDIPAFSLYQKFGGLIIRDE
jgi:GNAT superfamily N-acetyltransferase